MIERPRHLGSPTFVFATGWPEKITPIGRGPDKITPRVIFRGP